MTRDVQALMGSQDPVRHFERMIEVGKSLIALPAQLLEHGYSCEAFGSWWSIVRFRGITLRVVYDGRDRGLSVERSASTKAPYVWKRVAARTIESAATDTLARDVVELVQEAALARPEDLRDA